MSLLQVDNVTHWSIPGNNLEEAEHFYHEVLGLEYTGRLGNSNLACVAVSPPLFERRPVYRGTP